MFTLMAALEADLRARYAEPQRFHHGQAHIDALLAQWRQGQAGWHDPQAMELAIWFHDAVCQPGAKDNERQSEALLRQALTHCIAAPVVGRAARMILATERHAVPTGLPTDEAEDIAAFLDMDLSILGAEPATYDAYALAVEREFVPVVGIAAWRAGRAAFLHSALASTTPLFQTEVMREALEDSARANMARELTGLTTG